MCKVTSVCLKKSTKPLLGQGQAGTKMYSGVQTSMCTVLLSLAQTHFTLFKRMPKRVKAERRVFVYDNCCNFHKLNTKKVSLEK